MTKERSTASKSSPPHPRPCSYRLCGLVFHLKRHSSTRLWNSETWRWWRADYCNLPQWSTFIANVQHSSKEVGDERMRAIDTSAPPLFSYSFTPPPVLLWSNVSKLNDRPGQDSDEETLHLMNLKWLKLHDKCGHQRFGTMQHFIAGRHQCNFAPSLCLVLLFCARMRKHRFCLPQAQFLNSSSCQSVTTGFWNFPQLLLLLGWKLYFWYFAENCICLLCFVIEPQVIDWQTWTKYFYKMYKTR